MTETLRPGEKCPTCGRRQGPITQAQLMADAAPQAPDPAEAANPPTEEELAAERTWSEAREVYDHALADLTTAKAKARKAQGALVGRDGNLTYANPDPDVAARAKELIAMAKAAVEEAGEHLGAAQREYNRLQQLRAGRLRAWRLEEQRKLQADREAQRRKANRSSTGALQRLREMIGG